MGPLLADASSSRSREAAIETLIDMDPNGATYRIARAKVGGVVWHLVLLMIVRVCKSRRKILLHVPILAVVTDDSPLSIYVLSLRL